MQQTEKDRSQSVRRKRRTPVLVASVVLLLMTAVGTGYLIYGLDLSSRVSTDDASIDCVHVSVSSKMMGRIQSSTADEGSVVEAGQILVQLDDGDLRAQQAQLTASLTYARLNLNLALINRERAKNDFERTQAVFKSGNVSAEQFDHVSKSFEAAEAQTLIARAQIDTATAQLGVVEAQLANTKITSPISGVVASRSFAPGEVIQPGQSIFLINDLSHVWVVARFDETRIRLVHPGNAVKIDIDAYPDLEFRGRLERVGAAIVAPPFMISESTKTTQKIPVKILFEEIPAPASLLPGMSVEVTISVEKGESRQGLGIFR